MALRTIVYEGEDVLLKKARPITVFDEKLATLAADMLETMHAKDGIGLAANQIGLLRRIFVMDLQDEEAPEDSPQVFINPEILEQEGSQTYLEGCLSLPGLYGYVERPAWLKLHFQDLEGVTHELEARGLAAVCIAHEIDHLNGILFRSKALGELQPLSYYQAEEQEQAERE